MFVQLNPEFEHGGCHT